MAVRDVSINFRGRDRLSKVTNKNVRGIKKFDRALEGVERQARDTNRQVNKTGKSFKGAGRAGAASSRRVGGAVRGRGGASLIGGGALVGGAALAGAVGGGLAFSKALDEAAKLELGIARVMSLVRDPADQAKFRDKIESIIRDNTRLGRSVEEVSAALFKQISQQGLSEQSFENLNAGMQLAIGGFAESQGAISAVNKLLANFEELGGDASKAANLLFTGQVFGDTDISALAATFPKVAGLAASQGLGAAETIALVSVLTRKLGTTGQAVTATRGLILSLSQSTDAARKELRRLGVPSTVQEFQKLGLEESLLRLNKAATAQPELMRKIIPEVEALSAAFALDEKAIGDVLKIQRAMNDDIEKGTGLADSFNRVLNTTTVKRQQAAQARGELFGVFGEGVAPSVNRQLDEFTSLAADVVDLGVGGAFRKRAAQDALVERQRLIDQGVIEPTGFRAGTRLPGGRIVVEVESADGTKSKVVRVEGELDVGVQERGN